MWLPNSLGELRLRRRQMLRTLRGGAEEEEIEELRVLEDA